MNQYKMKPFVGKPIIEVTVPGSKSITNRALLLAALSEGKSVLKGVLFSDDSRVFMEALKTLGYEIDVNEKEAKVTIVGHGTQIPKQAADVYVAGLEEKRPVGRIAPCCASDHMNTSIR